MKEWTPPRDLPGLHEAKASRHTSFLFEAFKVGNHVHVKVRAATRHPSVQVDHSRGLCGELTMSPTEWFLLRQVLESAETGDPQWVDDEEGHVFIIAGAGAYDLADVEHPDQCFIEIQDAS